MIEDCVWALGALAFGALVAVIVTPLGSLKFVLFTDPFTYQLKRVGNESIDRFKIKIIYLQIIYNSKKIITSKASEQTLINRADCSTFDSL